MKTHRLRVRLLDVTPDVVRVIDVPTPCPLPELHHLLQTAIGWTDSHLHEFVAGPNRYGVPDDDEFGQRVDESTVGVLDLPSPFTYLYDFGDGWEHEITVLGPGGDRPGCVAGEGMGPPEDCGGPAGYERLLAALADPTHPEHDEMKQWAGRLIDFDLADTDRQVRECVGEVPASVRLVLDLAAGGVKLTPGGRLPRVFVRQVQEVRPLWSVLGRPAMTEDDLQPLAVLQDLLRHAGLLRMTKGKLAPTRVATNDLDAVRRLRTWFEPGSFDSTLVEITVAVLLIRGPMLFDDLAVAVFPMLGYGWMRDGESMTTGHVRMSLAYLSAEMRGLDLVEEDSRTWRPGASARTLLPRMNTLVRYLERDRGDVFE
jgi:hypothetical protein